MRALAAFLQGYSSKVSSGAGSARQSPAAGVNLSPRLPARERLAQPEVTIFKTGVNHVKYGNSGRGTTRELRAGVVAR